MWPGRTRAIARGIAQRATLSRAIAIGTARDAAGLERAMISRTPRVGRLWFRIDVDVADAGITFEASRRATRDVSTNGGAVVLVCRRVSRMNPVAQAAALIAAMAVVWASSLPRQAIAEEPSADGAAEASANHSTQAVRLRMLMLSLEQLTFETLPGQLDQEPPRQTYLDEIQSTAEALARAADRIPDAVGDLDLTAEQAQAFRLLAARLRKDATDLGNRAASGDIGSAGAELDPILARCNDCHRTFDIDPMGGRGPDPDE